MKKIAVFGHDLKFISYIVDYFTDNYNYEIRVDHWDGHEKHAEERSLELVEWADILFCEFGVGNVIWCQKHKKADQKLIVRLHRFEMNTRFPPFYDYDKIDRIITISPYVFEEFHRVAKVPRGKMTVIFNAVDTKRFAKQKVNDSQFHIGMVGYVPKLKRPDRALDIFERLYNRDPRYKLYIKGASPKEVKWISKLDEQLDYYETLFSRIEKSNYKENVYFEGWGDVADWLTKIGYVLSVSDYESFHLAPIEGMASGAFPIVLQREGARYVFPDKYIFRHVNDVVDFITMNSYDGQDELVRYVEDRFSLEKICVELDSLLQQI